MKLACVACLPTQDSLFGAYREFLTVIAGSPRAARSANGCLSKEWKCQGLAYSYTIIYDLNQYSTCIAWIMKPKFQEVLSIGWIRLGATQDHFATRVCCCVWMFLVFRGLLEPSPTPSHFKRSRSSTVIVGGKPNWRIRSHQFWSCWLLFTACRRNMWVEKGRMERACNLDWKTHFRLMLLLHVARELSGIAFSFHT